MKKFLLNSFVYVFSIFAFNCSTYYIGEQFDQKNYLLSLNSEIINEISNGKYLNKVRQKCFPEHVVASNYMNDAYEIINDKNKRDALYEKIFHDDNCTDQKLFAERVAKYYVDTFNRSCVDEYVHGAFLTLQKMTIRDKENLLKTHEDEIITISNFLNVKNCLLMLMKDEDLNEVVKAYLTNFLLYENNVIYRDNEKYLNFIYDKVISYYKYVLNEYVYYAIQDMLDAALDKANKIGNVCRIDKLEQMKQHVTNLAKSADDLLISEYAEQYYNFIKDEGYDFKDIYMYSFPFSEDFNCKNFIIEEICHRNCVTTIKHLQ